MIYYILQTMVFQLLFLLIYDLLLKKETFFNYNRVYLLFSSILSLVLPFFKLESLKTIIPQEYYIQLPAVIIGEQTPSKIASINTITEQLSETGFVWAWSYIIYIGMIVAGILFLLKLFRILKLYYSNSVSAIDDIKIISLPESNEAFSFFNLVFLGENIKDSDNQIILKHELVHIKEYHSLDLVWLELIRIIFWFNPLLVIYQNRIAMVHEYIADSKTISLKSREVYYQELLNQIFKTNKFSFVNHFNKKSLIKNRIAMMEKSKSARLKLFKYALLVPIVYGMLTFTNCEKEQITEPSTSNTLTEEINQLKLKLEATENLTPEEIKAREELFLELLKIRETLAIDEKLSTDYSETTQLNTSAKDATEVPFAIIDEVPLFKGCDPTASYKEKKDCTSSEIAKFVNLNFNSKKILDLGLTGSQRISVIFKINKEGRVIDVRARAPHKALENEAIRVVSSLPGFIPGNHMGETAVVPYSLPIIFQIKD